MGNIYRIIKEITLTCYLFRDVEAISEKFKIENEKLEDRVFRNSKKKGNTFADMFNLKLWKVNISNDTKKNSQNSFKKEVIKLQLLGGQ
ncbi:hypothetical protein GLOIN_2v1485807 [Rhizophagus clarus]|uniref:Uncharacterized protein n=1 Tax=Rhizophagus clarus TaxID=94130 RepID=A0A8H3KUB5_9GLOM|nr:hypothetical protein GLOIN_2v1485807 [Rhizophagus clarus]